jgi:hypothetical protein
MAVSGGMADGQDRWIGNFGLGQRWFPDATEEDSGNWMIGYNVFFDNDFTRSHQRGGVGVEVQFDWLRLASNFYYPLSDWKGSYDFDSARWVARMDIFEVFLFFCVVNRGSVDTRKKYSLIFVTYMVT